MAAVTATVLDCRIISGPHDAGSSAKPHVRVELYLTNGATQVAGGTDTLACDVQAALRAAFRNAKTYTLRDWMVCQTAFGTAEYAATGTVSTNTISLTPKAISDWSTNATITASNLTRPIGIAVICEIS
jgi:hypothetical protein